MDGSDDGSIILAREIVGCMSLRNILMIQTETLY